jgi:2'-5' RNA ligase
VRLFVAIEFDDAVRDVLHKAQQALAQQCDGVRWVPAHQLHLTVKFLGEVPDRQVDSVAQAVARAASQARPCTLAVEGCGCFPPRGAVRIVWAGGREDSGALVQCVEAVERELESSGFPRERRRFSPHVTIGRVREDRSGGRLRDSVVAHSFPPQEQPVKSLTLMSSVLSPKGPTYARVSTAALGGG